MSRQSFLIYLESFILRKGISTIINQFQNVKIQEVENLHRLRKTLKHHYPDYIVLDEIHLPHVKEVLLKEYSNKTAIKFIVYSDSQLVDQDIISLSLYEPEDMIMNKMTGLVTDESGEEENDKSRILSEREKLVLEMVAKGYINKEIADKLFISMHTVITHRKNITRKLGIKTVSGLTVYAILNNIIKMEDIQQ